MMRLDTLLVLAHEPITAKLIKELVGDAMAREVIVIDNPGTAMGVINNNTIDAVVMEAAFPGAVGKTGVETFREVLSDIPIISLVHLDSEEAGVLTIDQGADDFLILDHVNSLNMGRAITSALRRRTVDRELARSRAVASRFHEIIEAADDLVLIIDTWEKVESANPAAMAFFGLGETDHPRITDLLGSAGDIWHEALPDLMLDGRFVGEVVLTPVEGEPSDHAITLIHHERAGSSSQAYNSFVAHDLSALRAAAEKAHMEQMIRSKDQFVASVSHELRTPLTAVLGFTELLHSGALNGQQEEMADIMAMIAEQAQEVSSIVEDLMVGARADIGTVSVVPVLVRADSQVRTASDPLLSEFNSLHIDVEPVDVWADPVRVRQVIRNLLTNARRYGGPTVEITSTVTDDWVTIHVRDDGVGIAQDRQEDIFEPFNTSGPQNTRSVAVGLGLTVSRQLAQLMGGELDYEYTDGWSEFSLRLPRKDLALESDFR